MRKLKSRDQLTFNKRQFVVLSSFALIVTSSTIGLTSIPAWAVCSYSGTRNQEGSLKHDGSNLYRCDSSNTWENLGALSAADNLGNHTATQNLILGSYYLSGDGGNEGIYVDASGNVGVGVNSPAAQFHLGGSYTSFQMGSSSTASDNFHWVNELSGTRRLNLYNGNKGSGSFLMSITTAGQVGIGTTAPSSTIEISSNTSSLALSDTGVNVVRLADGSSGSATNGMISAYSGGTENIRLYANGSNNSWINAGYVGIGTTSPLQKLHVNGSVRSDATYPLIIGTSGFAYYPAETDHIAWYKKVGTYNYYWRKSVSGYPDGVGEVELMTLTDSGNVGIGITGPTAKLHVNGGSLRVSGSSSGWFNFTDSAAGGNFGTFLRTDGTTPLGYIGGGGGGAITAGAASDLVLRSDSNLIFASAGNSERMRIDTSGNVGIGTTSPGQKLSVAGTIESTTGGVKFPDGNTQTSAFQKTITIRTNAPGNFTLSNGGSAVYTASCVAGEVATGGGCSDSGYKMFYQMIPSATGYSCGWYNTSGSSVTISGATVYVNCLK